MGKSLNWAEPQFPNLKNGNMNNHLMCLLWKPNKIKHTYILSPCPGGSVFHKYQFSSVLRSLCPTLKRQPTLRSGLKNSVQAFPCHYTELIWVNFPNLEWKNCGAFTHQGKTVFHGDGRIVTIWNPLPPSCVVLGKSQLFWDSVSPSTKGVISSVSVKLCMPGGGALTVTVRIYSVTTYPGLSTSVLVYSCCASIIINSSAFHCQKWSGLNNKLFGHSIYSLHYFSRRSS